MSNPLIRQFQLIDDQLNEAWVSNDVSRINSHLSEDWVLLEPRFGIVPKTRFIDLIQTGDVIHMNMKKEVLHVNLHQHIAIVVTRGLNVGVFKSEPFDANHWVTNIYRKEGENWICIMTQEAPVACQ